MGEIATSDRQFTLYYNPDSKIGKKALAYIKAEEYPVKEIDLLKTTLTGTQLKELADRLDITIDGLVHKEHPDFEEQFDENPNFSEDDWIKLMRNNPQFIKEPILIKGEKTIFINTPSDIANL